MIISFLDNANGGSCGSGYSITTKAVTMSATTEVLQAPENIAWNKVSINAVHVYESGYTSGYTDGYASGSTDGFSTGFSSGYTSGYTDGYTSGSSMSSDIVADMTGVGFRVPYSAGTLIEFNFMCPIFDGEYSGETLFVASKGGYDERGNDDGGASVLCKYDTTTVGNVYKNKITTQHFASGFIVAGWGSKDYFVRILGSSSDNNNVLALARGMASVGEGNGMSTQLHDGWISMFAMRNVRGTDIMPGTLPRYFKRLKIYNNSLSQGGTLVNDIRPRSDGKMWDFVTNQEANIVWEKYDGTYPTTFTMVSEYNV